MKYLHIRNLDKYHPGYKDRDLKWAKIYFQMVQGDPDCELITNEIDWCRLVKFIILELQAKKPIPLDDEYLRRKGFNLKKRSILLTLKMLQPFVLVDDSCNLEREKEKEKEEDKEKEKEEDIVARVTSLDSVNDVKLGWNIFADKNNLAKIITLSDKRKKKIRARLKEDEFDFAEILNSIEQSDFLLGKTKDWKVDFDFVINNMNNYLKILEGKYKTNENRQGQRGSIDHNKYKTEFNTIK